MKIEDYNRKAWDQQVETGCRWTQPVTSNQISAARDGQFSIVLTPQIPVPDNWFPELADCETLCLACGGGQQGPILAAAGANVTVLDNSPGQLGRDRKVAERDNLQMNLIQGDMRDLSAFGEHQFDLVFHPCSVSFIPDPQPVFDEVYRVLKPGGVYLFGCCNPIVYLFDYEKLQQGDLVVRHSIPYSDLADLTPEELEVLQSQGEPLCFGHSLDSLIGGQLKAGLHLTGFFEDTWGYGPEKILDKYLSTLIATRAIKPLE